MIREWDAAWLCIYTMEVESVTLSEIDEPPSGDPSGDFCHVPLLSATFRYPGFT